MKPVRGFFECHVYQCLLKGTNFDCFASERLICYTIVIYNLLCEERGMHMEYRIIIDSCGDLPLQMKEDPHIVSVPLTLRVGDVEIIDDETFDQKDFLEKVAACEECPKSACPSPDCYLQACQGADRVYIVTLSAELSGSYNSALLAARMFEDENPGCRCHVFNSRSASVGQTLIGLNIQDLEQMGASFDEVVVCTEAYIEQQHTFFVLDNLDTLRKNGRLSRIKAFVASALKIKPVMGSTPEGAIAQLDQTRGANKALKLMCAIAAKDVRPGSVRRAAVAHCNCEERALMVAEEMKKLLLIPEVIVVPAAGVTSMYANDGGVVLVV